MVYAISLMSDSTPIPWSSELAYAIGLITTDGNLSKDGRHLEFTSKDMEQIRNFKYCLGLRVKVSLKSSGYTGVRVPHVQFGNVKFYRFLLSLGLHPAKSKTLNAVNVPDKYFFDFLRGHFDGDGHLYSYWDSRWKNSFMYYLAFSSASPKHILWLRTKLKQLLGVQGHITRAKGQSVEQLKYAKREGLLIFRKMYASSDCITLTRKRKKVLQALQTAKLML
jgi:hypothetical protein